MIQAWDEGMQKMSVGETAKLTCTPDYGYGLRGFPPVIPPNSDLTFEVELLGALPPLHAGQTERGTVLLRYRRRGGMMTRSELPSHRVGTSFSELR